MNQEINELLVQRIIQIALRHSPVKVLDLYSGAGNIAFAIAKHGIPVVAIEHSSSSVQNARQTAKRTSLPVEVRKGDANRFQAGDTFFDIAILDPPRKGASGVITELSITRPKSILYVSCNPHALRKDLREAKSVGYQVNQMIAFEMFPQTQHIEILVELVPN